MPPQTFFLIFESFGCNGNNHIYTEPGVECTVVNSRQCHGLHILLKVFGLKST